MSNTATRKRGISPTQRADSVRAATIGLADLVAHATTLLLERGADDHLTQTAWEAVEKHGATIHRQSRLLAGKSKGG